MESLTTSNKTRSRAATLALGATVGLTVFKVVVADLSGSVGVLSEAVHSFLDLISALVAFFTIREAGKPADSDHPFGHGKIETLSSLLESVLLVVAAIWIVYEGIQHWAHPQEIQYQGLAILAIAVSMVASYFVYKSNLVAAQTTESSAIHVNALHFLSDVVASAAVLLGLLLIRFTGLLIIDPIIAFLVAAYIVGISAKQVKRALMELVDVQLPESEIRRIREIIRAQGEVPGRGGALIVEAHELRTRKSGATRHIDFHLNVCKNMTVSESHEVCDEIETAILKEFPGSSINIHVEPCDHHGNECAVICRLKLPQKEGK